MLRTMLSYLRCQCIRDQSRSHLPSWYRNRLQCATVLKCTSSPVLGPTLTAPLLAHRTSVSVPLLVPGPVFPPGTGVPITLQGPAFLPIPSTTIVFSGVPRAPEPRQSTGAPLQSTVIPPKAGVPWPGHTLS